jgi:hypothetical protein
VAGLWQKVDEETGKPIIWFLFIERDGSYEGLAARLYPRPGDGPTSFICVKDDGESLSGVFIVHPQRMWIDYFHRVRGVMSVEKRDKEFDAALDLEMADRKGILDRVELPASALASRHLVKDLMVDEASEDLLEDGERPQGFFTLTLRVVNFHGRVKNFRGQKKISRRYWRK